MRIGSGQPFFRLHILLLLCSRSCRRCRRARLSGSRRRGIPKNKVQHLNLWILNHASIQVNTFPRGHVAASVSTALAILPLMPAAGLLFVLIAISIALGAVIGRYYCTADALIAAAVALAMYLLEFWLLWH